MCPLWLIIGKAAHREMWVKWYADDPDAFAAQEERRSSCDGLSAVVWSLADSCRRWWRAPGAGS